MVATAKRRTTVLDLACQAETLGFAGIACPSLGAAMAFCVSLAHVTKTIKFWTSIQPIYYSHAIEMANTAAHIHEVSNSRFGLGLGVSHGPVINRLGATTATPLADIKTYVETMRAQERFSGELPPIYLAALRNKMLDLATEVSQGAIWANAILSNISAQLSRIAEPNRVEKFFANMVPTVISDDLAAAHEIHRKTLVGYVSLPNYRNYWRSCGYGEQIDAFEKFFNHRTKKRVLQKLFRRWIPSGSTIALFLATATRFVKHFGLGHRLAFFRLLLCLQLLVGKQKRSANCSLHTVIKN